MFSFFHVHYLFFLLMAIAIVPLSFLLFARKKTGEKAYVYFLWIMLACFVYSFAYTLELMLLSASWKIAMIKLQYLGAVAFAPLVLFFTLAYTTKEQWIAGPRKLAFLVIPIGNLLLVGTNELHYLFYSSFTISSEGLFPVLVTGKGYFYWVHQGYTLLLIFGSLWVLVKRIEEVPAADSRQVFMVILGLCSPLFVYVWYLTGNVPFLLDPIPVGFLGTGLFFFLGLKNFKLFRIAPIAYRTLFDNLQEGVMVLDSQGALVTLNLSAAKIMGIKRVHQASALKEINDNWPEICDMLRTPRSYQVSEFTRVRDGHTLWYLLSKSKVSAEDQHQVGSLLVLRDITHEKNFQIQIENAKIAAETANKAKSEFLANMSHEIRTPLNGVIGFTELLTHTDLNEQQRRYAQTALTSATSLLDLINDILDLAKIESGKTEVSLDVVDLHELLETIVDVLRFQAHQKGLELLLDLHADVPRRIKTDELKLKQVLINLLNNAVKFTQKGEVVLLVETSGPEQSKQTEQLLFSVQDSGIGIAPDKQHLIFDAFSQADSSTTKKFGGTGLGLTISNKLLSLMDSRIQLESEPGQGSRFFFVLSVEGQKDSDSGQPFSREYLSHISQVVILDGNSRSGTLLQRYCEDFGLPASHVENVNEAFSAIENGSRPVLVLVNNRLLGKSSRDAIQQMMRLAQKAKRHAFFVPLLSSNERDGAIDTFTEIGCLGTIDKPVSPTKLREMLGRTSNSSAHVRSVATPSDTHTDTGKGFTLLVAEDNPINRMLVKVFIEQMSPGAKVLEAENGKDAFAMFETKKPDLVITDIHMPEMNGYELLQAIREYPGKKEVPVIGFTANAFPVAQTDSGNYHFDDYLTKPVAQKKFQQVVGRWMESISKQEER